MLVITQSGPALESGPTSKPDQAHLYFKEGASDKEYHAMIEPKDGLFVVNFAYGRRNSALQTGTKTQQPVDYDTAKRIFDKLVKEKTAKGYTPGPNGTSYQHTENAQQVSGILPQLPNPVDEDEVEQLINNTTHCAQEKYDGRHVLAQKRGAACDGINKKGLIIGLALPIIHDVRNFNSDFVMDGECVADVLYAFDLLMAKGEDIRRRPYCERYLELMNLMAAAQHRHIELAETAFKPQQKRALFERLRKENREGIVFKRLDAPYTAGRPNSGGPQLKYKFYATASFIVGRINDKRSVMLQLYSGGVKFNSGNVTIPANKQFPSVGAICEVKYLYAFKESGCIYQPIYLGERDDVDPDECTVDQLKYKPTGAVEDEP